MPFIVGILIVASILSWLSQPSPYTNRPDFSIAIWLVAIAAIIYVVYEWFLEQRELDWRLLIGSSDGSRNYFTSPNRMTLLKVRDVLTDKMNGRDTNAVYNINFQTGTIENVSIGKVEQIGAVVTGSGNTVNAATGSGRVGTSETTMTATNSPGAQIGSGHTATGNTYMVDYASVLPEVVRIQQHYDRDPRTQDLARRLAELEFLMRSGTPTQNGKDRLRSIVGDVTSALQAYPAMVQFFQHIGRLAGFDAPGCRACLMVGLPRALKGRAAAFGHLIGSAFARLGDWHPPNPLLFCDSRYDSRSGMGSAMGGCLCLARWHS